MLEHKLKIFVVDDHAIVREGVAALVNMQPGMEVIGQASDGAAALEQVQQCVPDIVIMDVSMPNLNGTQVTAQVLAACPAMRVVALTRHSDASYARQMLQAGARGYVLKQAAAQDLIAAIHTVATGGVYLDATLAGRVVGDTPARGTSGAAQAQALSDREVEVVRLIALGYSNKEIAAQLDISVKTVETYKARAMEKLQLYSRAALVRHAMEQGWFEATE